MRDKSHLTAINRHKPSAPMAKLKAAGLLVGRVLDYGSGKGYDASYYLMDSYDPFYQPVMPHGLFDTIVCNFVLNVIASPEERQRVISDIHSRLRPWGKAYITVRTDKKRLNGITKLGTWQGWVELDLPIVQRGSGFATYCLTC